ncbi:hypothetical protein [Shewanella surugensis]|uniref:Uncharacterized protein n=1 Tax=Shewanella surugensis TaxID=212020 RepID=A0ABT0LJQ5_9GAMM|nr:hypothetical protein [Shewanella surugensis]MCL1127923.1 hypothetical protein [Shewanella surugensis]
MPITINTISDINTLTPQGIINEGAISLGSKDYDIRVVDDLVKVERNLDGMNGLSKLLNAMIDFFSRMTTSDEHALTTRANQLQTTLQENLNDCFNQVFTNNYLKEGNSHLFQYCIDNHLEQILETNPKLGQKLENLRDRALGDPIGADDGLKCLEFLNQNEHTFFEKEKDILDNFNYIQNRLSSLSLEYSNQSKFDESDQIDYMKQRLNILKHINDRA